MQAKHNAQRCPNCNALNTFLGYSPGDHAPCRDCRHPVLVEGERPDGSVVAAAAENAPTGLKWWECMAALDAHRVIVGVTKPNTLAEMAPKPDMVNHPPHYTNHPSGVECIEITEHMNFCLGNAMKYIWRAGEKGDALEDLKKARWYLDREIARIEKTQENDERE